MNNVKRFMSQVNKIYYLPHLTQLRVGDKGDGGYVTLQELNEETTMVHCAGIGDDVSFELDFKSKYDKTWFKMFDPTIDCLPLDSPRDKFVFSKSEIVVGELEGTNNLLKMDIEGDEWRTLRRWGNSVINSFSQIVIEFHLITIAGSQGRSPYFTGTYNRAYDKVNEDLFEVYADVLEWLNKYFYIHHIHPNNSLPKVDLAGCSFPPLLEVSFVRKDLAMEALPNLNLQHPVQSLDYPNKIDRPDIIDFYPIGGKSC